MSWIISKTLWTKLTKTNKNCYKNMCDFVSHDYSSQYLLFILYSSVHVSYWNAFNTKCLLISIASLMNPYSLLFADLFRQNLRRIREKQVSLHSVWDDTDIARGETDAGVQSNKLLKVSIKKEYWNDRSFAIATV